MSDRWREQLNERLPDTVSGTASQADPATVGGSNRRTEEHEERSQRSSCSSGQARTGVSGTAKSESGYMRCSANGCAEWITRDEAEHQYARCRPHWLAMVERHRQRDRDHVKLLRAHHAATGDDESKLLADQLIAEWRCIDAGAPAPPFVTVSPDHHYRLQRWQAEQEQSSG
jgi:hypothetical protein